MCFQSGIHFKLSAKKDFFPDVNQKLHFLKGKTDKVNQSKRMSLKNNS